MSDQPQSSDSKGCKASIGLLVEGDVHSSMQLSSKRRKIRKVRIKTNNVAKITDVEYASKFMNDVTDGVLFEIFVRLPDWRSAIQVSSVCRRWRSLISHPNFFGCFIKHHHYCQPTLDFSYPRPYTVMFRFLEQPFCVLFPEKSKLHLIDGSLFFISSCDDLLLMACCSSECCISYSVCNALTGQRVALPEAPLDVDHNEVFLVCGVVCKPNNCDQQLGCTTNTQCQYKVVLIDSLVYNSNRRVFQYENGQFYFKVTMFCSETGKWSKSNILYPPTRGFVPAGIVSTVICKGIFYALELSKARVIVAFDPFSDSDERRCYFIDFPVGFGIWQHNRHRHDHCLGVVRGRVRLSRLTNIKGVMVLKIWELKNEANGTKSWVLKHNVRLKIELRIFISEKMVMIGFHPNNGDVVYMARKNNICEYNIEEDEYEKVGEFHYDRYRKDAFIQLAGRFTRVVPIIHPIWRPTLIPPLPNPSSST